jgi:hypothetical protein
MATLREAFSFDETLTKPDAAATGLAHLLTRDKLRKPVPLPPVSASRGAEPDPQNGPKASRRTGQSC